MNETDLNATLERRGQMDVAHGPGCYALTVDTPDAGDAVARHWHRHHDTPPSGTFYDRVAAADEVLYVGAASNVYERLCDHVAGDVRKAAFLEAFPPDSLHSIWPKDSAEVAFREEQAVGRALANVKRRVWTDGVLL